MTVDKSVDKVYNTSYYITQKIHIDNKIKNNKLPKYADLFTGV